MKPRAILICGKLCCGKSTLARRLCAEERAVVLSCDELVLSILGSDLGDRHDEVLERVKAYLYARAEDILKAGAGVILEWGFWRKSDRDYARAFFEQRGFESCLYYIDPTEKQWRSNIAHRNREVSQGAADSYYVDEGLLAKLEGIFEPPLPGEADVVLSSAE